MKPTLVLVVALFVAFPAAVTAEEVEDEIREPIAHLADQPCTLPGWFVSFMGPLRDQSPGNGLVRYQYHDTYQAYGSFRHHKTILGPDPDANVDDQFFYRIQSGFAVKWETCDPEEAVACILEALRAMEPGRAATCEVQA